jgi:hypothetical protein
MFLYEAHCVSGEVQIEPLCQRMIIVFLLVRVNHACPTVLEVHEEYRFRGYV